MTTRWLPLADGCTWSIQAADPPSAALLSRLGEIMQLQDAGSAPDLQGSIHRPLSLQASPQRHALEASMPAAIHAARCGAPAVCLLELENVDDLLILAQTTLLSRVFAAEAQSRGGALVHGALAARPHPDWGEAGVLLCAPSGTGKTTASERLPPPWRSLCDDAALVVRGPDGAFWAHPWPTWSRFFFDSPGRSWPVPHAVRLEAVFFLEQAPGEQAVLIIPAQAAASLVQVIQQATIIGLRGMDEDLARRLRLEWFDTACALAHRLPAFRLQLSLHGAFWQEIERVLPADEFHLRPTARPPAAAAQHVSFHPIDMEVHL